METLTAASRANRRIFPPDATIVLVGCHSAGKRTLGFLAAKHLGRRLLTEDHVFEQATGCSRATFLQRYGRATFNSSMATVLAQTLDRNRQNCVVECATGTLSADTQEILSRYAASNPVVYVHRDKDDLYRLLKLPAADAERMLLADHKHREFSNLEYFNLLDTSGDGPRAEDSLLRSASSNSARLIKARQDFVNFVDNITGQGMTRSWVENPFSVKAIPPEFRTYTFVLHLRLSVLMETGRDLADFEASAEAVELIIDTWPDNYLDIIAMQVAVIRRKLDVPVIFNVEENPREERHRPLEERDTVDLALMLHGLRLGVEYLSLDLERSESLVAQVLAARGRTRIIGNYIVKGLGAPQWTDDVYVERYARGQTLGCHIVRIARFCTTDRNDELRDQFIARVAAIPEPKPHIVAYDFSVFGVVVPFQGKSFQPCRHDSLMQSPREYLVGLSTTRGILRDLFHRGRLQPLSFYALGSNVYYSASPSMHRAAYEHYMMPHTFDAKRCTQMEEIIKIRTEPGFGGASLVAPFKVSMMSRVDHLSSHATAIGAVNTLLPLRGQTPSILDHANARNQAGSTDRFYGDNTDWSSIMTCLSRAISPRNSVQPSRTTALVVGAGGMARAAIYALLRLGCRRIFVHNRTAARAEEVAAHFNAYASEQKLVSRKPTTAGEQQQQQQQQQGQEDRVCFVLPSSATEPWPEGYQQPTMIVSCIPAPSPDEDHASQSFRMPAQWLMSPTGGVVIELAYEPLITPLVVQMRRMREEGNTLWVIVDGLEVVSEMATAAFELMTGRKAPRNLMRRVCNETWEKQYAPFQYQR
ncbi:hypothetical protein GGR56DRAFT_670068 [Xylariaceae sp. FL0804]|nr:hypothetical protein GGR56DRAFT_670068 [Xylariaceae sp. FL0804]